MERKLRYMYNLSRLDNTNYTDCLTDILFENSSTLKLNFPFQRIYLMTCECWDKLAALYIRLVIVQDLTDFGCGGI